MNSKILIFIIAIITGTLLSIGGGYLAIDNYLHPQGLMFEGIVLSALGILLILMVTIALSIGQTILIFGQIMEQQVQIQKEMREMTNATTSKGRGGIESLLSNILPQVSSISITDLNGKDLTNEDGSPIDLKSIRDMMMKPNGGITIEKDSLKDMNLEQLEKELSEAVKSDNFERAEKINEAIKALRGDENNSEENNSGDL